MDFGDFNPRPCTRSDGRRNRANGGNQHFNPRPCTRSDICCRGSQLPKRDFNPRPCTRSDAMLENPLPTLRDISTHAPARGATGNVTSRLPAMIFQPTPLHEERPWINVAGSAAANFNPRPCTRSDIREREVRSIIAISTHAPARGATRGMR